MSVVLYHGGSCADGATAAWAAWRALGETARYVPVMYNEKVPDVPEGEQVYLLDFSYPPSVLRQLAERAAFVLVLDHHVSAERDYLTSSEPLPANVNVTFDMERSGAMLAWNYFHHADAPKLVRYVEDRDIWRWALPHSHEINAWLRSWPQDFATLDRLAATLENDPGFVSAYHEGGAILRAEARQVATMCDHFRWGEIGGHRVPVVNATVLFSEVGDELCRRHPNAPFSAYYFDAAGGARHWGLRSRGGFDVSAVAKAYGGGGHAAAAGFRTEGPSAILEGGEWA